MPPAQRRAPRAAVAPVAAPEVPVEEPSAPSEDAPAVPDAEALASQEESQEAPADSGAPEQALGGDDESPSAPGDGLGPDCEPDLVHVAEPCAKCYPEGWFEGAENGVRASCPHLSIVYGDFIALERSVALELGYTDGSK